MAPQVIGIARNGLGNGEPQFAVARKEIRSTELRIMLTGAAFGPMLGAGEAHREEQS